MLNLAPKPGFDLSRAILSLNDVEQYTDYRCSTEKLNPIAKKHIQHMFFSEENQEVVQV